MRCNSCGTQIPDDVEAVFETTNVVTGTPSKYRGYTTTSPIWLCPDCAAYRRKTIQLTYLIIGGALIVGAILAMIGLSVR